MKYFFTIVTILFSISLSAQNNVGLPPAIEIETPTPYTQPTEKIMVIQDHYVYRITITYQEKTVTYGFQNLKGVTPNVNTALSTLQSLGYLEGKKVLSTGRIKSSRKIGMLCSKSEYTTVVVEK